MTRGDELRVSPITQRMASIMGADIVLAPTGGNETMKITQAELDNAKRIYALKGSWDDAIEFLGITIQRDPPEAMVKLAGALICSLEGRSLTPHEAAIRVLQHTEKALRDAPNFQTIGNRSTDWISRSAALKAVGAEPWT